MDTSIHPRLLLSLHLLSTILTSERKSLMNSYVYFLENAEREQLAGSRVTVDSQNPANSTFVRRIVCLKKHNKKLCDLWWPWIQEHVFLSYNVSLHTEQVKVTKKSLLGELHTTIQKNVYPNTYCKNCTHVRVFVCYSVWSQIRNDTGSALAVVLVYPPPHLPFAVVACLCLLFLFFVSSLGTASRHNITQYTCTSR